MKSAKNINIVIPMAGEGRSFKQAGYSFPKPLIDIGGKSMIELVLQSLKIKNPHKFILIVNGSMWRQYSLSQIIERILHKNYDVISLQGETKGALCTVLNAIDYVDTNEELIIINSDQIIDINLDQFITFARYKKADGALITFPSTHPRWSYARATKSNEVIEVAEKKVISDNATVGVYYFKSGKEFIKAALSMIEKDIRFNNEFFVCPVYNELILEGKKVIIWPIRGKHMHSLGTPEDLFHFISKKIK